jgi:6-phospho-beta-glucosidase
MGEEKKAMTPERTPTGLRMAIVGGGGFRTPRLIYGLARAAERVGLAEVTLSDLDANRLETMEALCQYLVGRLGARIRVTAAADVRQAVAGAAFVLLTYRPGGEIARAADERAALEVGVLGQETVGPGGLFMALRSIPLTLDYLGTIREMAPEAYVINFCNPVGILSEAVATVGDERFVGVCDTPDHLKREVAALYGADTDDVRVESVGLNHLGWFLRIYRDGRDVLPDLLAHLDDVLNTVRPLGFFTAGEIRSMGALPTEYVYFYLHADRAVDRLRREGKTRGEHILEWSGRFYEEAHRLIARREAASAWDLYVRTLLQRSNTYLATETGSNIERGLTEDTLFASGGYEGVALAAMEGLLGHGPATAILNVPSYGVVDGLQPGDIFEGTCYVDRHGIVPLALTAPLPDAVRRLILQVKGFEKATVQAALSGRPEDAVAALLEHPLITGRDQAEALVARRRQLPGSPWA